MNHIRKTMHKNLVIAKTAFRRLSEKELQTVEAKVKEIISLKYQMESIANQKGYSDNCKTSIPICKGECCKWQYPKNLTHIDFFISIFNLSEKQQTALVKLILTTKNDYCPILTQTGCFLSFEQRPIPCTNAYPCFNDRSYWHEKEKKIVIFNGIYRTLENIVPFNHYTRHVGVYLHDVTYPIHSDE